MDDETKVSVIVPIYRVEAYLEKCVDSILRQDYGNLEVILVDDGSPDGCPAICDALARRDSRVRVIHQANGGLSRARNAGIEASTGAYLLFVDSDDWIAPDMCSRLLQTARETGADIVSCNLFFCYPDGTRELNKMAFPDAAVFDSGEILKNYFLSDSMDLVVVWNKLYRRELFFSEPQIRFPAGRLHEDYYTMHLLYERARNTAIIPDALYHYLLREGSIMRNFGQKNVLDQLDCVQKIWDWAQQKPKDLQRCVAYHIMRRAFDLAWRDYLDPTLLPDNSVFPAFVRGLRKQLPCPWRNPYVGKKELAKYILLNLHLAGPACRLWGERKAIVQLVVSGSRAIFPRKTVFLMSTPWHGNLGDQAIVLAEYRLLRKVFPGWRLVEYPTEALQGARKFPFLRPAVRKGDVIVIHGGGNLGSLYPREEEVHRWLISTYRDRRILMMPQSIFFSEDEDGRRSLQESQSVYQQAENLTIFERDAVSHAYGKRVFPAVHHELVPDVVTSLEADIGAMAARRAGVCFFLRADKEKVLPDALVQEIKGWLSAHEIPYLVSDTVISENLRTNAARWAAVRTRLEQARKARMVVTDRYHGLIFSVITRTPALVFRSYDTKISSGLDWFRDLPWVHDAAELSADAIEKILADACRGEEQACVPACRCGEQVLQQLEVWARQAQR